MADTDLITEELELAEAAEQFARRGSKDFVRRFTDLEKHPADPNPVSVFMAGSPGAGKTEASVALLKRTDPDGTTVRIDPDELRCEFEGYRGDNSWLFQTSVSILVEKIHDKVLENRQNFLLDGTFANLNKSKENIDRSLKKGRFVQIVYVYQDPKLAWEFVVKREKLEGRRILPEHFVA